MLNLDDEWRERQDAYRGEGETPAVWTAEHVEARMVEAYRILGIIPQSTSPKDDTGFWPAVLHSEAEIKASYSIEDQADIIATMRKRWFEEAEQRIDLPSKEEVSRMHEAIFWPLQYLGENVQGRWNGKGVILADALTLWAKCRAMDKSPNPYLVARFKAAHAKAASMALQGEARRALAREIAEACTLALQADLRLTNARSARIKAKFRAEFRRRVMPRPEEVIPDLALTPSALSKWRKRAAEVIAKRLRIERVMVR
jgi:hypothetical protein